MQAVEWHAALTELDLRLSVESVELLGGMVEEGVADEIILFPVVATDEYERQSPDRCRAVGIIYSILLLVYEGARMIVPATQMTAEPPRCLLRQIDEDRFYANFDGGAVLIQISAAVEVVLVNDRPAKKPLGPEDEVKRLAHGRLSNIVSSYQERMAGKIDTSLRHTSKVCKFQSPNTHLLTPADILLKVERGTGDVTGIAAVSPRSCRPVASLSRNPYYRQSDRMPLRRGKAKSGSPRRYGRAR